MKNAGLEEAQAGIKIAGRNINNLRYEDDTILMAEIKEELKSFLMKVKEEREKAGLKLSIQNMKIMASGPITSWQIGKQWKQWEALHFFIPKSLQMVTTAMKLKTVAPWKKSSDQPNQHIKKQRHYFADKGPSSQSYCFSSSHVWMWKLDYKESWTLKNWCFWASVLEQTPESPLDCRESSQSILKEISPEYSLEGLIWSWSSNTLATLCEEPTHWKRPWCWERLKAGEGDNRG